MNLETKYSYDDLLLVPARSPVDSRSDVVLETKVTPNNKISMPLISAPMDSVTGPELAQRMANNGGVGILHRFAESTVRQDWIKDINGMVGASIGIGSESLDNAIKFEKSGANFICVDVAHGHMEKAISFVERVDGEIDIDIMVGNVATLEGVKDLIAAGADSVKVGVGGGSHCTTREQTGHGYPQASAVEESSRDLFGIDAEYTIIADGGIRKPGDAVKALMLGADAVMMGGIFGRAYSSPGGGDVWGCASKEGNDTNHVEGVVSAGEERYYVEEVFDEFEDGIRSGLSYSGGHTIDKARENVEFVQVTNSVQERNGSFEV